MAKKVTTQEFIDRTRAVHGDTYDYSLVEYVNAQRKVKIVCHEHGVFEQSPNSHLNGRGCPGCGGTKKHTNELFIQKAREVHGDQYDYSKVDYIGAHLKVKIVCPEHGVFEMTPANHNYGKGCPGCADTKHTNESFIKKAREVHGDNTYDYTMVDYIGAHSKVKIVCPEHGVFEQRPVNHLQGIGCPGCANYGFDRTKVGFLYLLRSDCGRYMKIGITHNPKQRYNKLKRDTPFSFKRIELIEGSGELIASTEKMLLSQYHRVDFNETFDGHTEWVLWDESIRHKLLTFMS